MKNLINYVNIAASCYLLMLAETGILKSTSIAVGLALASFIDGRTMSTTIDKRRLALRAGVSMETLRRQLNILKDVGFIKITSRIGKSHKYTITLHKNMESTKLNPAQISEGGNPQNAPDPTQKGGESLHKSSPLTRQEQINSTEHRVKTY